MTPSTQAPPFLSKCFHLSYTNSCLISSHSTSCSLTKSFLHSSWPHYKNLYLYTMYMCCIYTQVFKYIYIYLISLYMHIHMPIHHLTNPLLYHFMNYLFQIPAPITGSDHHEIIYNNQYLNYKFRTLIIQVLQLFASLFRMSFIKLLMIWLSHELLVPISILIIVLSY